MNLMELVEELKKTKKKEYKLLARRIEANMKNPDPTEAKEIKRECMVTLVDELDKYHNDALINQLLLFVGNVIHDDEKANRK